MKQNKNLPIIAIKTMLFLLPACSQKESEDGNKAARQENQKSPEVAQSKGESASKPERAAFSLESVIGRKYNPQGLSVPLECNEKILKKLIGQSVPEFDAVKPFGGFQDSFENASGDTIKVFYGPFTDSVMVVALKFRKQIIVGVNVTMKADESGLVLRDKIILPLKKLETVKTRMLGPDNKGKDFEYENYGEELSGHHALIHQDKNMINVILLNSGIIPITEALPSINDLPEDLRKKTKP